MPFLCASTSLVEETRNEKILNHLFRGPDSQNFFSSHLVIYGHLFMDHAYKNFSSSLFESPHASQLCKSTSGCI